MVICCKAKAFINLALTKFELIHLKISLHKQTETTVSNKKKCIAESTQLTNDKNSLSTLYQTAKQSQC